eukprot:m.168699 g.168699  ORF g.168699 m.168699 type:complete len:798 (-) comp12991_c0_seq1:1957-4350(-)
MPSEPPLSPTPTPLTSTHCSATPSCSRRRRRRASELASALTLRDASDGRLVWLPSLWSQRRIVLVFLRHIGCRFCKEQIAGLNTIAQDLEEAGIALAYVSLGSPSQARQMVTKTGLRGSLYVDDSTGGTTADLAALVKGREAVDVDDEPPAPPPLTNLDDVADHGSDPSFMKERQQHHCRGASDTTRAETAHKGTALQHRGGARAYAIFSLLRGSGVVQHAKTMELGKALLGKGFEDEPQDDVGRWPGDIFQVGGVFVLGPGNRCEYSYRSQYAGDHPDPQTILAAATGRTANGVEFLYPTARRWAALLRVHEFMDTPVVKWPWPSTAMMSICFAVVGSLAVVLRVVSRFHESGHGLGNTTVVGSEPPPRYTMLSSTAATSSVQPSALYNASTWAAMGRTLAFTEWILVQSLSIVATVDSRLLIVSLVLGTLALAMLLEWMLTDGTRLAHDRIPRLVTPATIDQAALDNGLVECDCGGGLGDIPLLGLQDIAKAAHTPRPLSTPVSPVRSRSGSPLPVRQQSVSPELDICFHADDVVSALAAASSVSPLENVNSVNGLRSDSGTSVSTGGIDPVDYQDMLCYVRYFLARPHPSVGRPGPVCPFVPMSLKRNSIYFAVVRDTHVPMTTHGIQRVAEHFLNQFDQLSPTTGRARQYKAVVMIFPDVSEADCPRLIDAVQLKLKPQFVARGLMIGEFHRFNNTPGLRNPNFYPLRTPIPCLAIRHMVPSDIAFLNIANVSLRRQFLTSFLDVFDGTTKDTDQEAVKQAKAMLSACNDEVASTAGGTGGWKTSIRLPRFGW